MVIMVTLLWFTRYNHGDLMILQWHNPGFTMVIIASSDFTMVI